ncbi:hypothetical protein [Flavonifractor sp. An52]|uniref:hypothetical protein n=1 Tax=Flavonifractor sp. An52 TaxID=1965642 RepID=UPI001302670F|nr:hypothetical protein [Flavonifractor sp. An52]
MNTKNTNKPKLKTEVFTMRTTPKRIKLMKQLAEREEKTVTRLVEDAIDFYIKEQKGV